VIQTKSIESHKNSPSNAPSCINLYNTLIKPRSPADLLLMKQFSETCLP